MVVSLLRLKAIARQKLPANSTFRRIMETEKDEMSEEEYHTKLDTWWKLLDLEE